MSTYVTQSGMSKSQPGVSVSFSCPSWKTGKGVELCLRRHYSHLPNDLGGHGVSKRLDYDGLVFETIEQARAFAIEHGYLQEYFTAKNLRDKNAAEGFNPKTRMFEGPNPPRWWIERGRNPLNPRSVWI